MPDPNRVNDDDEGSDVDVDGEHDDDMDVDGGNAAGGGSGKKKDNKAAQLRKVQNRIAQREFRMRKQAYVRDLEARVQLLSSSRDEQIDVLGSAVVALIEENKQLRSLLSSVSGFIDEGLGGALQRIGVQLQDFEAIVNRGDTEAVHDAINVNSVLKGLHKGGGMTTGEGESRRGSMGNGTGTGGGAGATAGPGPNSTAAAAAAAASAHSPSSSSPGASGPHPQRPSPGLSRLSISNPHAAAALAALSLNPGSGSSSTSYPSKRTRLNPNSDDTISPEGLRAALKDVPKDVMASFDEFRGLYGICTDNPKLQAVQLLSYHLKNKQLDKEYCLPPSLQSTPVQRSMPHDRLMDGVIWSSLRDALILQREQYDEREFFSGLLDAVEIHSDDVMDSSNWELKEYFLRKYWFLISQDVLDIANRWRAERGEEPLYMASLRPPDAIFGVGGPHQIQAEAEHGQMQVQAQRRGSVQVGGAQGHQRQASGTLSVSDQSQGRRTPGKSPIG